MTLETILRKHIRVRKPFENGINPSLTKSGVEGYYKLRRLLLDISALILTVDGVFTYNPFPLIAKIGEDAGIPESYPETMSERCFAEGITIESLIAEFGGFTVDNDGKAVGFYLQNPRRDFCYAKIVKRHITSKAIDTCLRITEVMCALRDIYGKELFPADTIGVVLDGLAIREGLVTRSEFELSEEIVTSDSAPIPNARGIITGYAVDDYPGTTEIFLVDFGDEIGTCTIHKNDMFMVPIAGKGRFV